MFSKANNLYQAFRDFYEKTHGKAYRFALKHARTEALAEEILQTAYLKVWEKRHTIQSNFLAFKAYLYTTVRNLVIKEYHRQVAEQEAILQYRQLQQVETAEDNSEILLSEIYQVVATLPKKQQQVFRLIKFEGLTYREAAKELSISESTVEKHIIKALRTLRSKLSDFAYTILF